jgi:autophagy-related protein 17
MVRSQHQDALDATLESLGSQVVPPSFHQSSLESSLFGLHANEIDDDQEQANGHEATDDNEDPSRDRRKWKTLRDFVDERGLEDVFESIEGERTALDETLAATESHAATITSITNQIRSLLSTSLSASKEFLQTQTQNYSPNVPSHSAERQLHVDRPSKDVSALLTQQERSSTGMASHLESLAAHYDQMATALKEKEAGEDIGEEDMEGMWTFVTNIVTCRG